MSLSTIIFQFYLLKKKIYTREIFPYTHDLKKFSVTIFEHIYSRKSTVLTQSTQIDTIQRQEENETLLLNYDEVRGVPAHL